jgi:hypothetical protein
MTIDNGESGASVRAELNAGLAAIDTKVAKAGDTMTGALGINIPAPALATANLVLGVPDDSSYGVLINNLLFGNTPEKAFFVTQNSAGPADLGVNSQVNLRLTPTGEVSVGSFTASTSPSTGALTVAGGLGVGGNIASGSITANGQISTTASVAGLFFGFNLENINSASNAATAIQFKNNAATLAYIFLGSSNYAAYGGANALNLMTDTGGGPIEFVIAGTPRGYAAANGAFVWGAPIGGDVAGAGAINAQAVYDDGTLLTCFGAQYAARSTVDLKQWDAFAPTGKHKLAHRFVEMLKDFDPRNPQQYVERMLRDEALPGMPTTKDWKHGEQSLGEMYNRLWLAVELLASAFAGAVQRISDLEAKQRG